MKTKDPLERLLQAAARAPKGAADTASFALEARVMATWRGARRAGNGETFVVWLRRATICACLLALMTLVWNYHELTGAAKPGDELAVADAAMRVGVEP